MATETLLPTSLDTQTGLTGALADVDEGVDSPDGNWLTTSNNTNTTCVVSIDDPTGPPTVGAGLQNVRAYVRKTNHSTNPTVTLEVLDQGSVIATLVSGQTVSSTTGTTISGTWNANLLTDPTGASVTVRVTGTVGGGSPANRASVEVGAIDWECDYSLSTPRKRRRSTALGL